MWVWSAATLVLLAGAGGYAWTNAGGSGANDAPYRTAAADRGTITASVRATGSLTPITTVLVGSQLSGQVIEILADYNSPVKAGQVLARLNPEQIKSRQDAARADLAQARADVAVRRAQIDRARASRLKAEATLRDVTAQRDRVTAQLADARRTLERQSELNSRAVGAQTSVETARTAVEVQTATLASSEAQIAALAAETRGLEADVALAEGQLQAGEAVVLQREAKLRDVEIDLERTEIRSPVDGVVIKRDIDLGQTVAASLNAPTLFQVAQDLRRIDIYANIDEADVGRLKPGQPVTFGVNAYPNRTFEGAVKLVRLSAQTVQNVVTYTAVIEVQNRDEALLPGMTANLQIVTEERRDVLRVPNAALRFRAPGATASPTPLGPAPAQAQAAERGGGRGGRAGEAFRERLMSEVQPTPEQASAIQAILAEARGNAPGREPGLSDEERRAAGRQYRAELMAKVSAVLDPERRAKLAAMMGEGRRGPADPGSPGRVFVLDAQGRPQGLTLRVGATDGSFTEVIAGDLKEGAPVIVGGGPRPAADAPAGAGRAPGSRGPRLF
ncbi:efflux RND transporter periplasmic adaptor subunit [Salinarimonas soli]|uniref:HlyD family secretion protein n=1 Tax=Salinarimonas soli TaxID=1638099 RepID=A0A5B2VD47_9HYPH|nr:efflux RND transporter periplasmic adaptor subunit [Salinarimonas soli]KAA2237423.1 HlyD family secretion protein [Salinarimonas soli]